MPRQIPLDDVLAIEVLLYYNFFIMIPQELKQFGMEVDMTSTFDFIDKYFLPQDVSFLSIVPNNNNVRLVEILGPQYDHQYSRPRNTL